MGTRRAKSVLPLESGSAAAMGPSFPASDGRNGVSASVATQENELVATFFSFGAGIAKT